MARGRLIIWFVNAWAHENKPQKALRKVGSPEIALKGVFLRSKACRFVLGLEYLFGKIMACLLDPIDILIVSYRWICGFDGVRIKKCKGENVQNSCYFHF